MKIAPLLEPLFEDIVDIEFPDIFKKSTFKRIINSIGLTDIYGDACKTNDDAKDLADIFFDDKQQPLIIFLNSLLSQSREYFFEKITMVLEQAFPLLPYIPSIEPIIADLASIGIPDSLSKRITAAWSKKNQNYPEKVNYFISYLISRSRNMYVNNSYYGRLRNDLLNHPALSNHIPYYIKENTDIQGFWEFIKTQGGYRDREVFLKSTLNPLMEEGNKLGSVMTEDLLNQIQVTIDLNYVNDSWLKSIKRLINDPDGAITAARSLLETVCKHILEGLQSEFNEKDDLLQLYSKTANILRLSPEQHTEQLFKQILSGCYSVVSGLAGIRNKHGDSHGLSEKRLKPALRHAELAVNLAGSMSKFLLETYQHLEKTQAEGRQKQN